MKLKKLREKDEEELNKEMDAMKKELSKERASLASGTRPENPGKIRKLRRGIARILTLLRERELKKIQKNKNQKGGVQK